MAALETIEESDNARERARLKKRSAALREHSAHAQRHAGNLDASNSELMAFAKDVLTEAALLRGSELPTPSNPHGLPRIGPRHDRPDR
jgi:hypothetical protein